MAKRAIHVSASTEITLAPYAAPMNTSLLVQRVLDGLANGSLYGSLALAITLVYRSSGRVNLDKRNSE